MLEDEGSPGRILFDLGEEFGSDGVLGVVERFLSDKTGEILVRSDDPVKVLFHAEQVWTGGDSGEGYSPFLELFPSTELPFSLSVGREVRLNARRVEEGKYDYQATVVWAEGKAPSDYRTEAWYSDMQRTVSCVRNKVTSWPHLMMSLWCYVCLD